jgi:hypothetical protein
MSEIKTTTDWSNDILDYLIQKNTDNPNLKFWLRQRNSKNRLDQGLWFNGNEDYIHIGFSKLGAGNLSTQSIGFVIWFDENNTPQGKIELVFRDEKDTKTLDCYNEIASKIGDFHKNSETSFYRDYQSEYIYDAFDEFLSVHKPIIDSVIKEFGLENKMTIPTDKFEKTLAKILKVRETNISKRKLNLIIANITWNSKDWKEPSEDASGHAWVGDENIPHESWNFDFENPRNQNGSVFGFAKFTKPPKVEGTNNLIIFYSQGKIVGFYGKAEILKEWVSINEQQSYNLIGNKDLSIVLPNKIESIKDKGYLENLERVGQVGFSYLKKNKTAHNILDEAMALNPGQESIIQNIKNWVNENSTLEQTTSITSDMDKETDLNQIFFGPPGTGKTYHTINEAIKIVDPKFYLEHHNDRTKLKERFKLLLLNNENEDVGQIGFTTFHQSFSYEDFIEGIKPIEPKTEDTYLKYQIQEGIFKKICRIANDSLISSNIKSDSLISLSQDEYNEANFFKMSLGNTQNSDEDEIFDYCIENNCITIGFGDGLNFTGKNEKDLKLYALENNLETYPIKAMNYFSNYLKTGNYIIISNGNHYIRAIAKVIGDYEFKEESPFPTNPSHNHFRKVEWIYVGENIPIKEIYNRILIQQTIYKFDKKSIKQNFFVKEKQLNKHNLPHNPKNFVLIVDEINRGNVSSIFGELITLIEKDKRANTDEELSVILPYSKKEFKVPQNVYIIGTMNTADRSIEALDTALRRRFSFKEMPPEHNLILTEGRLKDKQGKIDDIDVVKILETINNRIEKLIDKDHKIGHAYFLDIENEAALKSAFHDKVIPLLEEYFFGDFGKISLVLGSSFITKETKSKVTFAKTNEYDSSIAADLLERSVYEITPQNKWDFKAIYE